MLILKMKFTSTTHLGKKTRKDLITRMKEKEKKKKLQKLLKMKMKNQLGSSMQLQAHQNCHLKLFGL